VWHRWGGGGYWEKERAVKVTKSPGRRGDSGSLKSGGGTVERGSQEREWNVGANWKRTDRGREGEGQAGAESHQRYAWGRIKEKGGRQGRKREKGGRSKRKCMSTQGRLRWDPHAQRKRAMGSDDGCFPRGHRESRRLSPSWKTAGQDRGPKGRATERPKEERDGWKKGRKVTGDRTLKSVKNVGDTVG